MIERINAPGLSDPPGYSHAVVASGERLVVTAGAVPLDADGNLTIEVRALDDSLESLFRELIR